MKISIVVPTLNRALSLQVTLRSLVAQRYPAQHWEVVVVDNGSTDDTRKVTEEIVASYPERSVRYVYEPVPGLLSGRHRGTKEALGSILVFVDDDIEADPDWLGAIADAFEDPTVHVVGGRNLPHYENPPPAWLDAFWQPTPYGGTMCEWLSLLDLGEKMIDIDPRYVWGLNLSIRRQTLLDVGGFHPDNIPKALQHWQGDGETGLCEKVRAAGLRAVYQPRAVVRHRTPASRLTVEYFESRAYYAGICNSYSRIRSARGLHDQRGVLENLQYPLRCVKHLLDSFTAAGRVRQRARAAYEAGFKFHQTAARTHPEVLEWVLRADYWDYRLPDVKVHVAR